MPRELKSIITHVDHYDALAAVGICQWLKIQARESGLPWLLGHADDGVIWGRMNHGALVTAHETLSARHEGRYAGAALRDETLQQARLFGEAGELFVWRMPSAGAWSGRLICDATDDSEGSRCSAIDEPQLVWGTRGTPEPEGFTLLEHGAEGLCHAVPLVVPDGADLVQSPVRLWMRHYLSNVSWTTIQTTRLLRLEWQSP